MIDRTPNMFGKTWEGDAEYVWEQIGQLHCKLRLLQQKKGAILPFFIPSNISFLNFFTSSVFLLKNKELPGLSDFSLTLNACLD